jgi:hypothetical protein
MNNDEARVVGLMAMGRVFRLMSRPYQPGDELEYAVARAACLDAAAVLGMDSAPGYRPDYARDRRIGAAGD